MNNFDTNSKGINIDVNIFYDDIVGQMNFDESMSRVKEGVYQYIDFGNIDRLDNNELITINNLTLEQARNLELDNIVQGVYEEEYEEVNDFINDLKENIFYEYPDLQELIDTLIDYGIDFKENFESLEIRGYSQGDLIEVIVPHILKNTWGCTQEVFISQMDTLSNDLQKYTYDLPIGGSITINQHDINIAELVEDTYSYYDDDLIESIINNILKLDLGVDKSTLEEELKELFPSSLDR